MKKTRILVLTAALGIVACANPKPGSDPASLNTTAGSPPEPASLGPNEASARRSAPSRPRSERVSSTGAKVTLRGPVKSDEERTAIETRARQTAGVTDIDNQLEVKK